MSSLLTGLNPEQKSAVLHTEGPSIILAGAGSGKTRVLVHKVLYLVQERKIPAFSIVMITFTNKAAKEMKSRILQTTDNQTSLGYIGTFHSFSALILRRDGVHIGIDRNFTIYDDNDQGDVLKAILKDYDNRRLTPSYVSSRISAAKNSLITPEKYLEIFSDYTAGQVAEIYAKYEKELEKNKALDFDDLIMKTTQLFLRNENILAKYQEKYPYLLVDEFQDTNSAQYLLARLLAEKNKNITVVGDFSQSIYSWRGADIKNLEKFQEDFSESQVFNLERNYRSTQNILDFAFEVISKNQGHPILQLKTTNTKGEEIEFYEAENEEYESLYVVQEIERLHRKGMDYTDCAVLYRTNAQSRAIEEGFLRAGIPYVLIGGVRFYERKEVKDILSYLRLVINPDDALAQQRIRKLGERRWKAFKARFLEIYEQRESLNTNEIIEQIFDASKYLELYNNDDPEDFARLENIRELKSVAYQFPNAVDFLEQVALVESEFSQGEKNKNLGKEGVSAYEGVRLMTLHQAKGLEFEYVFIIGLEEGILPLSRALLDVSELEEERRLFYVGITRARKKLYITNAQRRFVYGRRGETMKSRFIGGDPENTWY